MPTPFVRGSNGKPLRSMISFLPFPTGAGCIAKRKSRLSGTYRGTLTSDWRSGFGDARHSIRWKNNVVMICFEANVEAKAHIGIVIHNQNCPVGSCLDAPLQFYGIDAILNS